MILLCSKKGDKSAERVAEILQRKQKNVFNFYLDDYVSYKPNVIFDNKQFVNEIQIDLSKITAIYFRSLVFPYLPESKMPEMYRNFLNRELISMFFGQLMSLSVKWVNHPFYSHLANYKIGQLARARDIGFDLPDTCIATQPEILFEFYQRKKDLGRGVITKAIYSGYVQSENPDEDEIVFTQDVQIKSIEDIPKNQPLLFQEKIVPDYEIRCFVIGNTVLAVKIESEECYNDYREIDSSKLKAKQITLPGQQNQFCIQLTKSFNLNYAAIDLIFKRKKYFFLDFNPTGEWLWYENNTALLISKVIVCLLNNF